MHFTGLKVIQSCCNKALLSLMRLLKTTQKHHQLRQFARVVNLRCRFRLLSTLVFLSPRRILTSCEWGKSFPYGNLHVTRKRKNKSGKQSKPAA